MTFCAKPQSVAKKSVVTYLRKCALASSFTSFGALIS